MTLSLPQLKKKVQRAVNAYVRERDKDRTCICGKRDCLEIVHYDKSGFMRCIKLKSGKSNKKL